MTFNSKQHYRRSIRMKGYDYTSVGAYFVTICTHQRECILGRIEEGVVLLSDSGRIIEHTWRRLPWFFTSIELDAFVVMPNHIHGIVSIVGAKQRAASQISTHADAAALPLQRGSVPQSLSAIIQNFKSVSTKKINVLRHTPSEIIWQRNFYEHIVRTINGERELIAIRKYITDNPMQWELDSENPLKQHSKP